VINSPYTVETWSVSGGGFISASGLFTAGGGTGGPYVVDAVGAGRLGWPGPQGQTTLYIVPGALTTPSVSTNAINNITINSATSGGNITSDGGLTITERGSCWSTTANPTITNSKTSDGIGTGSFATNVSSLQSGITYYLRAYATNSLGTAYGAQVTFTTLAVAPTISTTVATGVISTGATSGGNVTSTGGATVSARGVCWATTANPTTANSKTTNGTGTGTFTSSISGLLGGTIYYVRAYATNGVGTSYGAQVTFTTTAATNAVVTTTAATGVTSTGATSGGNVTSDGGASVTVRGICWSTATNPTVALTTKTSNGTGTGGFTSTLSGLTGGTLYYVRAYATNSAGTAYGANVTFTTTSAAVAPVVTTTTPITGVTSTGGTGGGNVTSDGGASVTVRGICWSTATNPTIALTTKTSNGTGTGSFTSTLSGLTGGTLYYVRAYATNSAGTSYGANVTFTTAAAVAPVVTTTPPITGITSTGGSGGGNVTSDGGASVTARGICWSTAVNPTVALTTKTSNGTGTGSFTSTLSGLTGATLYHVRAYATNSVGTSYGANVTFTTSAPTAPVVTTTTPITGVTATGGAGGGNVTSDGGAAVTVRGVCWSTSVNPTVALSTKTTNGTGTGVFTGTLSGLTRGTLYHVRAYATNSVGTSYGADVTFTTTAVPVVTTTVASAITSTGATSGGNVTSDGGASVTARGICWATTVNPTTANSKTTNGTGTGSFTSTLSDDN